MQSAFRILSEMDGTLARQLPPPRSITFPRLPCATLAWIIVLAAVALSDAATASELGVRLLLMTVTGVHAMGCAFLIHARNGEGRLAWHESAALALSIGAALWTLPVLSSVVPGAAAWQPGLAAISCVFALTIILLFWPLRLSRVTGNSFASSLCHVMRANLIMAIPLAVIFTMASGLAAWMR
jgi:hypothetical protein